MIFLNISGVKFFFVYFTILDAIVATNPILSASSPDNNNAVSPSAQISSIQCKDILIFLVSSSNHSVSIGSCTDSFTYSL